MRVFSKDSLVASLRAIVARGWVPSTRPGNSGGVGNTLEDLLGIAENNLPIPNAAEWELKARRLGSASLTTLFHLEPSPRALRLVPALLLPKYGWPHQQAGEKYPPGELSFRQTIHGQAASDRGFRVKVDQASRRVVIGFDAGAVADRHADWLKGVQGRVGLADLEPQPYWGFDDLEHTAGTKLLNTFYVQAEARKVDGVEQFRYRSVTMLRGFHFPGFLAALEAGDVLVDFDARTGHNHGTKFRLRQHALPALYREVEVVVSA